MNEHFIKRDIFQVGQFYQIDSFNPVYLDKTGELIAASEGKLKNWNGNSNEFHFSDEFDNYNGKVNMQQFWYTNQKQGDYDEHQLSRFFEFINSSNEIIDSVYKPKYYSRIGIRVHYILKKTSSHSKESFSQFYEDKFKLVRSIGSLDTTSIGFDLSQQSYSVKVNISYAKRISENDINAPKEGLLFDLDFYKPLDKFTREAAFMENMNLQKYTNENYTNILSSIAEDLGIL